MSVWALLLAACCAASGSESRVTIGLDARLELLDYARELSTETFTAASYLRWSDLLLRYGDAPELAPSDFVPAELVREAGGAEALERRLAQLRALARSPAFAARMRERQDRWQAAVERFAGRVGRDFPSRLERYLGLAFEGGYQVALAPGHGAGSQVNVVLRRPDGTARVATVYGPGQEDGRAAFLDEPFWETAWHELAHGVLDDLSEIHRARLDASAGLQAELGWDCYGSWRQCAREHVVRAVVARMLAAERGRAAADAFLAKESERFRHLPALAERLEEYERGRARYPSLAAFYGRLIDAFPLSEAPAAEAGPDWLEQPAVAFPSRARRAQALALAEKSLGAAPRDFALRLEQAVLLYWDGEKDAAARQARALLREKPGHPGARLLLILGSDDARERARERDAASAACRGGAGDPICRALRAGRDSEGALAAGGSAGPGPGVHHPDEPRPEQPGSGLPAGLQVRLAMDPRVELLSVALMLADERSFLRQLEREGRGEPFSSYAGLARRALAPLDGHPAVELTRALLKRGGPPLEPAQLLLRHGPPPALKPLRPGAEEIGLGGEPLGRRWLDALRDFSARPQYAAFWEATAPERARFEAAARREAASHFDPRRIAAYVRLPFPARYSFLLAPLLPSIYAANARVDTAQGREELRLRSPSGGAKAGVPYFNFDAFGAALPHELLHTVTDPWAFAYAPQLNALVQPPPVGCADGWTGCVMEEVVFAVTLRALARERGPAALARSVEHYRSRGFARLPALCRLLEEEYEKQPERYPTLKEFYPRLLSAYGVKPLPPPASPDAGTAGRAEKAKEEAPPPRRRVADTTRALRNAGVAAFKAGALDAAEARLREAVARDAMDAEAWLDLAVVLSRRARHAEALAAYARCLEQARLSGDGTLEAEALSSRAGTHLSSGRAKEARADWAAALRAAPADWARRRETLSSLESR